MAEQPVFWLGGKPGSKGREAPEAERFEAPLREACEACGFDVDEYVVAQGGFGGWLLHLDRNGSRYRLFWNGKARELAFEELPERGQWKLLRSSPTTDDSLPAFVSAVKDILQDEAA